MAKARINWKAIGPGLIWAAAAVGVSHLVQSTRAGANFGFQLVLVVLVANFLKYPFFQFGPRYAIATGESLISGYKRIGKWAVWLFLVLTVGTMFTIQAAVTSVTVGIIESVIPSSLNTVQITVILLLICALVVLIGHYKTLDRLVKGIVVILTLSTIVAVIAAFIKIDIHEISNDQPFVWNTGNVAFLVALVGWMPSAIDISVWNSLWTLAKVKSTGYRPKLKEILFDFNLGYFGTTLLSLAFLSLGALVMFNSGETFSASGVGFANQFFSLYTKSIGSWAFVVIAVAALATMFSTTLTVLDAYPRVLNPVFIALFPKLDKPKKLKSLHMFWIFILVLGAVLIIASFSGKMKILVDIATTLSFITAPVLGYLNLRAINGKHITPAFKLSLPMKIYSWSGVIVLGGFAMYYLLMKVGLI